jgi:hypothetical protein
MMASQLQLFLSRIVIAAYNLRWCDYIRDERALKWGFNGHCATAIAGPKLSKRVKSR